MGKVKNGVNESKPVNRFDFWSNVLLGMTAFFVIVGMFFSFSFASQDRKDTERLIKQEDQNTERLIEILDKLNANTKVIACLAESNHLKVKKTEKQCRNEVIKRSKASSASLFLPSPVTIFQSEVNQKSSRQEETSSNEQVNSGIVNQIGSAVSEAARIVSGLVTNKD